MKIRLLPALVMATASLWIFGCDSAFVVRKYDDSGKLVEEQTWLKIENTQNRNEVVVPHGLHVTWDTTGNRKQLMVFNRGQRIGYVLTWDDQGRLYRDGNM